MRIIKSREGKDAKDLSVLAGSAAGFLFLLSIYLYRRRGYRGPLALAAGSVLLMLSAVVDPRSARYDVVIFGLGFGGIAGALSAALLSVRRGDAPAVFPEDLSGEMGLSDLLSGAVAGLAGLGTVFALEAFYLRAGVAAEIHQSVGIALGIFSGMSAAGLSAGLWLARRPAGHSSSPGGAGLVLALLPDRVARKIRMSFLVLAIPPGMLITLPPMDAYQILEGVALGVLAGYPLTVLLVLASFAWAASLPIRADGADLVILARLTAVSAGLAGSMLGLALASMPVVLAGGIVCGAGLALASRVAPQRTVVGVLFGDRASRAIIPERGDRGITPDRDR